MGTSVRADIAKIVGEAALELSLILVEVRETQFANRLAKVARDIMAKAIQSGATHIGQFDNIKIVQARLKAANRKHLKLVKSD